MDAKILVEIVKTLTGEIEPIGETYTDEARFENLKTLCTTVDYLIGHIDSIVHNARYTEHSQKAAGEYAKKFLGELKESF